MSLAHPPISFYATNAEALDTVRGQGLLIEDAPIPGAPKSPPPPKVPWRRPYGRVPKDPAPYRRPCRDHLSLLSAKDRTLRAAVIYLALKALGIKLPRGVFLKVARDWAVSPCAVSMRLLDYRRGIGAHIDLMIRAAA